MNYNGEKMFIQSLVVGQMMTNCYIIGCEKTLESAVIDPGSDAPLILRSLMSKDYHNLYIINTHGHMDHIGANKPIKEATGASILIHKDDANMLQESLNLPFFMLGESMPSPCADLMLVDHQSIQLGGIRLEVLHTPGHTPGGICLTLEEGSSCKCVFTGDTLFASSIGRTDLDGGSYRTLIESIKRRLLTLDSELIIYPGHGPPSTIGEELKNNPFLCDV